MQRRTVLKWMAAALPAAAVPLGAAPRPDTPAWRTLEGVLERLLPGGEGVPSASELHAAEYLYGALRHSRFDPEIRAFVFEGAEWARGEALRCYGMPFETLDAEAGETVLRSLRDHIPRGEAWLSILITFVLEALLGDPLYGGNYREAGWRWLGHVPGMPRPERRYLREL